MQKIIPSIWFDNNALNAFQLYTSTFPNSQILAEQAITVHAAINNINFVGINGGPQFRPNATISFMYTFDDKHTLAEAWNKLLAKGKVLMPLEAYPWSEFYGWLEDEFGVHWQFYFGDLNNVNQQAVCPTLMFSQDQQGQCAKALAFYASIFNDFHSQGVLHYADGPMEGQVQHAQFIINGFTMMAMDSGVPQISSFNEGISFALLCSDQAAIDYYWHAFTQAGQEGNCGWCKDPFGVSWQIIPHNMDTLLQNPNAIQNMLKMKKIIISDLIN